MRAYRIILLLVAGLLVLYGHYVSSPETSTTRPQPQWHPSNGSPVDDENSVSKKAPQWAESSDSSTAEVDSLVPKKALHVLEIVRRTGLPPEGYVGGRVFQNREHRLPADGDYREFDVDPHRGGRNAERIIVEWQTKKAWYTGDHYRTFILLP